MKRLAVFLLIFVFAFSLFSCSKNYAQSYDDEGKLNIIATNFAQYSLAKEIVGNFANVELLIPAGLDSHSYDLTFSDIQRLKNADIIIYAGIDAEGWMSSVIPVLSDENLLVDISDGSRLLLAPKDRGHEHAHIFDGHLLSSPKNAICAAEMIYNSLSPESTLNTEVFLQNYLTLLENLNLLDDQLTKLSQENNGKKLYFGGKFSNFYLCENYGFEYVSAYEGCSEYSEPSPKTLKNMIDMMIQADTGVIFVSELSETQTAQKISATVGCEILVMHSCHEISKEDFERGETYLSLMKKNIENIREALS